MGGWALAKDGEFWTEPSPTSSSLDYPNYQDLRRRARDSHDRSLALVRPTPSGSEGTEDEPDKWVVRNRFAAVASSAVFIPAMCVGFAYVGRML